MLIAAGAVFAALVATRLIDQGWADIFSIGDGKFDLLPLAVTVVLIGLSFSKFALRMAVQAVLVAVVFLYLGRTIHDDWGQITGRDWHFSLPWLIASLVLMHSLYACQASGWMLLLRRFGHRVPYLPGFFVWSKSLLARYVPGNVLMVVGRVMMIEPYGVPKLISLTSVVYEQALLGAASATVVSLMIPLWPALRSVSSLIWLILLVPPLAFIGLQPAVMGRLGNFVLRKAGREPIEQFLPFWSVLGFILYYSCSWLIAGFGLFALVHSVTPISFTDLPIVLASAPLAWLLALVVFISPSGLGVREGLYAFSLGFAFNHEAGVASAFAILARFWQTMIEVSVVTIVMVLTKKFHRAPKPAKSRMVVEPGDAGVEEPAP